LDQLNSSYDFAKRLKGLALQRERKIKWILGVSIYLFLFYGMPSSSSFFFGSFGSLFRLPFYNLPPQSFTPIEYVWYIMNSVDVLFFLLTIIFATLFTTGFGYRNLMFKLSIYFFILACSFFFLRFAQTLIGMPYRF